MQPVQYGHLSLHLLSVDSRWSKMNRRASTVFIGRGDGIGNCDACDTTSRSQNMLIDQQDWRCNSSWFILQGLEGKPLPIGESDGILFLLLVPLPRPCPCPTSAGDGGGGVWTTRVEPAPASAGGGVSASVKSFKQKFPTSKEHDLLNSAMAFLTFRFSTESFFSRKKKSKKCLKI